MQLIYFIFTLFTLSYAQQQVLLYVPFMNFSISSMYRQDSGYNSSFFLPPEAWYNCSTISLFTIKQTKDNVNQNVSYYLILNGFKGQIHGSLNTTYGFAQPNPSSFTCQDRCQIQVKQTCPPSTSFFYYFDLISLKIQSIPQPLSFYVICDSDQIRNTFQWGLIVLVAISVFLITITSIHSTSWSLNGIGIDINCGTILIIELLFLIVIILLLILQDQVIQIIKIGFNVVQYILIAISSSFCFIQLLFLIPSRGLVGRHVKIQRINLKIRLLDFIGIFLGLGVCVGYYLVIQNWILNTFLCFVIIFACIKIIKFTSLRIAILSFCLSFILEMTLIFITQFQQGYIYNNVAFNEFKNALFLQIPTINQVYDARCSWFFFAAFAFPGIVFSYLYRYDRSRSQFIYSLVYLIGYIFGSIVWTFLSVVSPVTLPFGIVSQPVVFIIIVLFSCRRGQLHLLWYGLFYDLQYKDVERSTSQVEHVIQRQKTDLSFRSFLFTGLKIGRDVSWITENRLTKQLELFQIKEEN